MAGARKDVIIQDANEAALREFEEGLRIKQYKAVLVKTFKTKRRVLEPS
jgi:hypothetical protein